MKIIRLVSIDDGGAIYVDGKLHHEDHSVHIEFLPMNEPIKIVTNAYLENSAVVERIYDEGFPQNYADIKDAVDAD